MLIVIEGILIEIFHIERELRGRGHMARGWRAVILVWPAVAGLAGRHIDWKNVFSSGQQRYKQAREAPRIVLHIPHAQHPHPPSDCLMYSFLAQGSS